MTRGSDFDPLGPRVQMTEEEARLVQEIIHEYCGLSHGLDSTFFLERRLGPRLDALGLSSYREYYHYLRYDPAGARELEDLVERITTHETYLFREDYQLQAFREEILPDLHHRFQRRKRLLVWSAGCSTGEEVYTIAILLRESKLFDDWLIRVVGSDISRQVVAAARRGAYGLSSFRTTTDRFQSKYFREQNGKFYVRDDIRAMCSFGQLNLLATERFDVLGRCDAIFCRNVLMYLSQDARHRIVEAFFDTLNPGGYLLLGHSESLLNVTTRFDLVHLSKDLVYRRPSE
ncbi:CheR family methyltransferase [Paraliomyxa miuraensis]|uniref:CheR family methyltransferase n=1 Tax=Paraliomyxa miuraensis TaxID=376150 RepID=UPI002B1CB1D9|nr:protein-glutamate O-methyltransferase CheR [Paraliomyxa miuraensis]